MRKLKNMWIVACLLQVSVVWAEKAPVDYVNPLIGTLSDFKLSAGNTYPAVAMPWGMNFWVPQTGKMGDGWQYKYDQYQIRGFKQTHQPSPWINDYGQFSLMPVIGNKINEEERASWFSHKAETVTPYYYGVYLADYDIRTELVPTERAVHFRFTFPQSDSAAVVIDAFDKGSYIRVVPEENKIIGYTTRNSGGVPDNFKNYFVIYFDKQPVSFSVWNNGKTVAGQELESNHVGAVVRFSTQRGEQVQARVASSFISFEQAELNLKELGGRSLEQLKDDGEKNGMMYWDASLLMPTKIRNRCSIHVFTVPYFSPVCSSKWIQPEIRFTIALTTAKYCPDICLPIQASGIHSVVCSRC